MKRGYSYSSTGYTAVALMVLTGLFAFMLPARAEDAQHGEQGEPHDQHTQYAAGAIAVYHAGLSGEVHHAGGTGMFFSGSVGPDWLWLEGVATVLKHKQVMFIPLQMLPRSPCCRGCRSARHTRTTSSAPMTTQKRTGFSGSPRARPLTSRAENQA